MDRKDALALLDIVTGQDPEAAIEACRKLTADVWPLEIAAGIKNCADSLSGKWGEAGPSILRVSVNTLREQI